MKLFNQEFSQRLIVALTTLCIVFFLIYYAFISGMFYLLSAVILMLAIFAIKEYCHLIRSKALISKPVMILGSFLTIGAFAISVIDTQFSFLPAFSLFIVIILIFITHFKKIEGAIVDIATASFGIVYICFPLGMILSILYLNQAQSQIYDGRFWIIYLISVTKVSDIGAYLIGKAFGRKKLAPEISPNKTVEGAIGGCIASIGMSLFFWWMAPEQISFFASVILGALFAIFAQIGDLSESLIKRDAAVKDSGSIPGIGGILDMLDSIFINTPILYFFFLF